MMLEFTAGSVDDAMQCIDVTINEDLLVEGNETFTVKLSLETPDKGVTLENDAAIVTIIDADCKCLFEICTLAL